MSQVSTLLLNYTLQLVPERGFYFYFFLLDFLMLKAGSPVA